MRPFKVHERGRFADLIAPFIACFDPAVKCNQRCRFCYNPTNYRSLPNPSHDELIGVLSRISAGGAFELDWMGGEPLTRPDIILALEESATRFDLANNLVTNGIGLVPARGSGAVLDRVAPLVKDVGVSIHGASASTHDALVGGEGADRTGHFFERAIEAFLGLKARGVYTGILFSATRNNFLEARRLFEHIVETHGVTPDFFYLNRLVFTGHAEVSRQAMEMSPEQYVELLLDFRRLSMDFPEVCLQTTDSFPSCVLMEVYTREHGSEGAEDFERFLDRVVGRCYFGKCNVAVNYRGEVKLCTLSPDAQAVLPLSEHSLPAIWNGEVYRSYRSLDWLPPGCRRVVGDREVCCRWFERCWGGCKMGQQGRFGVDRWVGSDSVVTGNAPGTGFPDKVRVYRVKAGTHEFALREEQTGWVLYPLVHHGVFRIPERIQWLDDVEAATFLQDEADDDARRVQEMVLSAAGWRGSGTIQVRRRDVDA